MNDIERLLQSLGKGQPLENYIIPGLRSTLLASTASGGKIRLFEMRRRQEYEVTPHDHRYSFQCLVLRGNALNRTYRIVSHFLPEQDPLWARLPYDHARHCLDEGNPLIVACHTKETEYKAGDWYSMTSDEFHSIRFSNGAQVLFIEGPEEKATSSCLVPYENGRICNTFLWADWMMEAPR